jgi:hypothetical protein
MFLKVIAVSIFTVTSDDAVFKYWCTFCIDCQHMLLVGLKQQFYAVSTVAVDYKLYCKSKWLVVR